MHAGVVRKLRWALMLGLLAGCAAPRAAAPQTATATEAGTTRSVAAAAPSDACPRPRRPSRFREMTWTEYYADVRERAWRNNATVIWITPPKVRKPRPGAAGATACAR